MDRSLGLLSILVSCGIFGDSGSLGDTGADSTESCLVIAKEDLFSRAQL